MVAALTGCSQMTVLRTQEMKAVGAEVQANLDSVSAQLQAQNDSLRAELDAAALAQKRMQAEITMLSRRVADESERNDSRHEEGGRERCACCARVHG